MKTNPRIPVGCRLERVLVLGVLALPLLILLPGWGDFPYPGNHALYSDISLTHYPNALYLRDSIVEGGHIPLWSPLILSGGPFAASPLSGLWYPPGWLALLLPLPLGFNLLVGAHLFWGGWGVYSLLRSEGLGAPAACLSGLAFAALPKLFAHYGAGHLTLLYAVPWTPWLLLACRKRLAELPSVPLARVISFEAPVLALIFLADPRWAVYAGLLWAGYGLFVGFASNGDSREGPRRVSAWILPALLRTLFAALLTALLAALLAAPLALPLSELTSLSTRAAMGTADKLAYSLPWERLLGLAIPDFGGFHEYTLYAGQVVLLLALLGLFSRSGWRGRSFWLLAGLVSLCLALGENLPPVRLLAELPLVGYLRVPSRALFISGLAFAVLAGYGLQEVLDGLSRAAARRARLAITAYVAFLLALAGGIGWMTGVLPANFTLAAALALVGAAWLSFRPGDRIPVRVWLAGLFAICLLDLWSIDRSLFVARSPAEVLAESKPAAEILARLEEGRGRFRVYSPSYSLAQQTAASYGLELADGVDPLQLQAYAAYMEKATGVPGQGYSVTLPPFASGLPAQDNAGYAPNAERLGLLNVRYVVSEFPLSTAGLVFEGQAGKTYIYLNESFRPRAWVEPPGERGAGFEPVDYLEGAAGRISLRASGPGLLVLSEVAYPGWRVWIDDQPGEIEVSAALLRAVRLPPGEHRLVFAFQPLSVYAGLGIGAAAWLLVGSGLLFQRRRKA